MKIKMLASCAGLDFSYAVGETADVPAALGRDLIRAGFAEEVKSAPKKVRSETNADTE